MSSSRKRMSLFKAHNEIDRLRQQVMLLEHRCTCMPGFAPTSTPAQDLAIPSAQRVRSFPQPSPLQRRRR